MFAFFRKKEKPQPSSQDFASLINRRAEDFRAFYTERFGEKLNYHYNSLYFIDAILEETRISEAATDRKQWVAAHAGAYLYRVASLRVHRFQYLWYHPLDQPMMVVGLPGYRVTLIAEHAVQQRLDAAPESTITQLYTNFEQALLRAKPGDDLLFI